MGPTPSADTRLVAPAAAVWAGAFAGTGGGLSSPVALWVAVATAGLAWCLTLTRLTGLVSHRWMVLSCLALLACGAMAGQLRMDSVDDARVALAQGLGEDVAVRVTLSTDPVLTTSGRTEDRVRFRAALTSFGCCGDDRAKPADHAQVRLRAPVLVLASPEWLNLQVGSTATAPARLLATEPGDDVAALLIVDTAPADVAAAAMPYRVAEVFRAGLRDAARHLPEDARGLLPALVLGDEQRLTDRLRGDLRDSGLAHLTAVSGANVAIVVGAVLLVARRCGAAGGALVVLSLVAIVCFVVLARPQPSVLRAAVMGGVAASVLLTGAQGRGLSNLAAACLALILIDPWLSRSPGFSLSVLATAGILLVAPSLLASTASWLPRPIGMALGLSVAAQLAVSPLLVALSGELSLAAVPANLLAGPLVAPATVLGVAAALVSPVLPLLTGVLAWVGALPTTGIARVAHAAADLPGAAVQWRWGWVAAALGALALGMLLRVLLQSWLASVLVVLALAVALFRPLPGSTWPPPDWVLAACDVGQGDATALRAGPGSAVVVDAGPDPVLVDRCLDRLGVQEVPLLVVTHLHADHVGGVRGVSAGRTVAAAVTTTLDDPEHGREVLRDWSAQRGVSVEQVGAGKQLAVPGLTLQVLWPAQHIRAGSAPNQASVVLLAEVAGLRVLLTGDIEPEAQAALLRSGADLRADVLKVPHHGSGDQDEAFLAAVGADLGLVSAGTGNRYGHPAQQTLTLLGELGVGVLRTDEQGSIAIAVDRDGTLTTSWTGADVSGIRGG